jgi:translation initiation factor IF-1
MQNRPPNRGSSSSSSRSGPPRGIVGGGSSGPPRGIVGGGSSGPPRGIVGGNSGSNIGAPGNRGGSPSQRSGGSGGPSRGGYRGGGGGGGGQRRPEPEPDLKPKEEAIELEGVVSAVLAGTMFRVKLRGKDHEVLAHISGKMRKKFIRLVIGDAVKLEMSPYDMDKARIVYRIG